MNKIGSAGIIAVILIIGMIILAATAASFISNDTGEETTEQDIQQMLDEVLTEITTYIQIKDKIAKYYTIQGEQKIKRIALLIDPWISENIDVSQLTIQISNGYDVKILSYNGSAEFIGANTLFEHPIWDNIDENTYGFIATLDKDRSLIDHSIINGDMAFIIIRLSDDFAMKKKDTMTISLLPSAGTKITTTIQAPPPLTPVVKLE